LVLAARFKNKRLWKDEHGADGRRRDHHGHGAWHRCGGGTAIAAKSAKLMLADVLIEPFAKVVTEISTDVTDEAAVKNLVDKTVNWAGCLHQG
jgi:hypothetical protein